MVFKYDEYISKYRKIKIYEEQEYKSHYTYQFKIAYDVKPNMNCQCSNMYNMNMVLIARRDWDEYDDMPISSKSCISQNGDLAIHIHLTIDLPGINPI